MNRDEYLLLFEKFLSGSATPEEVDMIMSFRDKFEISDQNPGEQQGQYKEIEDRLLEKLKFSIGPRRTFISYLIKWSPAAAALVLVALGAFFFKAGHKEKAKKLYTFNTKKSVITPGSNKAMLTLANGKKIILNEAVPGTIIKQGNIIVKKQKDGLLQYSVSETGNDKHQSIEYNTLSTPKGGQYQIILPDSTKVWLNSSSSLKFPTAFVGAQRIVELTGEGYFEVTKNKHMPFKVRFNKEEVEVLGTHFNIMAYNDEEESRTTLFEGSVKFTKADRNIILVPGQQAVSANNGNAFNIQHADFEKVLAWKNGFFSFRNANIHQIMRQIARWYDVDVIYQGNLEDKMYGGRISKSKNITEILDNLELTGTIHFNVEGRRVTVMQ